jgi:hypothetical protein
MFGGAGVDLLVGDSEAFTGNAIGSGGDDILHLGDTSGSAGIGDHNIRVPAPGGGSAIGAGDDKIIRPPRPAMT